MFLFFLFSFCHLKHNKRFKSGARRTFQVSAIRAPIRQLNWHRPIENWCGIMKARLSEIGAFSSIEQSMSMLKIIKLSTLSTYLLHVKAFVAVFGVNEKARQTIKKRSKTQNTNLYKHIWGENELLAMYNCIENEEQLVWSKDKTIHLTNCVGKITSEISPRTTSKKKNWLQRNPGIAGKKAGILTNKKKRR